MIIMAVELMAVAEQLIGGVSGPKTQVLIYVFYCKRKRLSEIKVLQFPRFHPHIGTTFVVFGLSVWKVLKKAIAQLNIWWENFCSSSKIRENCETFLSLNFCRLRYI